MPKKQTTKRQTHFAATDSLGAVALSLAGLDRRIQNIPNKAQTTEGVLQPLAELASEEASFHCTDGLPGRYARP